MASCSPLALRCRAEVGVLGTLAFESVCLQLVLRSVVAQPFFTCWFP